MRDLAPVDLLASISFLIIVPPSLPAKSMQETRATCASEARLLELRALGSRHHGSARLRDAEDGRENQYRICSVQGTVPAIIDVVSGQAQLMYAVMQGGLPQVQAGKLRALAVTGAK